MPRLNGSRRTRAPFAARDLGGPVGRAVVDDDDVEAGIERAQLVDHAAAASRSSFSAGTIATRRSSASPAGAPARRGSSTVSGTGRHRDAEPEQLEQPPRAVRVRVLVEHALARAPAHLLRLRRVGEQLAVRRDRLVGVGDDDAARGPGSNQRSMPSCGFETIAAPHAASSNGRHVDEAVHRRVRAARRR